jgi:hypothetical protein
MAAIADTAKVENHYAFFMRSRNKYHKHVIFKTLTEY